jgi:hypothetical protein
MEFELKDYDDLMRDVFQTLSDEPIVDYENSEPLRRCWIKTPTNEYFMRLWNMMAVNDKTIIVEAELFPT